MHRSFITGLVYLVFCLCAHGSFADLSAGLVAYYPFEGNAHDASGNGHDGLEIGFLSYGNGIAGSCASFDGITTKIQVPHADDLSLDGTFTLSCWIKSEGTSAASGLLAKIQSDSPRNGYVLTANAELLSSDIRMNINKSWPAVQGTVHSTHSALDGHWHHLVGAYDGANLTLYLDGQIEMQLAYTNGLTINAMPLYIGWDPYSWSRYFNGEMDEVRIYKRALLLDEVQELFSDMSPHLNLFGESLTNTCVVAGESLTKTITISNAGNSDLDFSFCSPSAEEDNSLILHYTFDDDSGTTAVDQSGHGNDGLIMNDCVHVAGVHGQGLEIHGNSDHLSSAGGHVLLPEIDFNSIDEVTVALWVKEITMHHPHGERYITFGEIGYATNPGEIGIIKNSVGAIGYICGTSVSNHQFEPAQNVFVHYALTYSSGFMKTYRNGILIDTVPAELDVPDSQYAALGRHWWNNGYETSTRLTAVFDDVRIYNRALSDEEIVKLAGQDVGLVAYYPFTGNANDASGHGHDGTVLGAQLTSDRFGHANSAYRFDGLNDYIRIADHEDFTVSDVSLCAWIKTSDKSDMKHILSCWAYGVSPQWYNLWLISGEGTVRVGMDKGGYFDVNRATGTSDTANGDWHFVVAVRDTANSELKVYVDGVLETTVYGVFSDVLNPRADFWIGGQSGWPSRYFNGIIDDVRIYNRAITTDEIAALYTESNYGLVAYYPFSGNANDASGHGHDGTVLGAQLTSDRFGNANSAYRFDGVNDFIDVGMFDAGIKAVSMWVRQDARNEFDFYFGHNTFRLYASTLSSGLLMCGDGSPNKTYSNVSMDDVVGEWVHVVAIRDGADSKVYLNGVNVTESSGAVGPALASVVNLGRWPGPVPSARHYMHGDIDDVRVYDRVLSEGEVFELYSEVPDAACGLPEWLAVEPASGTVAPEGSMDVSVVYNASNMVAGDYVEHVLKLISNDPDYPELEAPVSMWVVPSVPEMQTEPLCTIGSSNGIAWSYQEGPVEYWVEAMAVQHYAPASRAGDDPTPLGWEAQNRFGQNLEVWSKDSGWIQSTSCLFTDLRLNTIYMYRIKASVMTEIGRLEGDWSDWTLSCQVPVLPKGN